MITVVDYGMGNLKSVANALQTAGADEVCVSSRAEDVRRAERIVLPGVGAFGECMRNLVATGLVDVLTEEVRGKGKPFLGICLGLQLLARVSDEYGVHAGLGWLPARVERLDVDAKGLKLPHVGWNEVLAQRAVRLLDGVTERSAFYFVHSYHVVCDEPDAVVAVSDYGGLFTAAVLKDNVFATQFHPEKSQQSGQRLLRNFLAWKP